MKILLLNGLSGSGKSTISHMLNGMQIGDLEFQVVKSYTTREKRNRFDFDHKFVSKRELVGMMLKNSYIASTMINNELYCAFDDQFSNLKINIYSVDDIGFLDVHNALLGAGNVDVLSVRLKNRVSRVGVDRRERYDLFLPDDYFDLVVENTNIRETYDTIYNFIDDRWFD